MNLDSNRAKKKKVGRKSSWKEDDIMDMIDIVCSRKTGRKQECSKETNLQ